MSNCDVRCYPFTPTTYYNGLSFYEVLCKLCGEMEELQKLINENMYTYFDRYFNEIMVDVAYNEETETLTLRKELKVSGTTHVYNAGERSVTIE